MRKFGALVMGLALTFAGCISFSSCRRGSDDIVINTDQQQLYVFNFNMGFGDEWLKAVAEDFEEEYKEHAFPNGKKGIQVVVDNYEANPTATTMRTSRDAIFFTESLDYYNFISQNFLRDVTDLVTTPIENGKSIEDKLETYGEKIEQSHIGFYKTAAGKYYGVPFHEGMTGMIYDIDLFESKSLYFSKAYDTEKDGDLPASWVGKTGERSKGPDGEYGTYDDGLPATYADFYAFMRRCKEKGVIPMTWAGKFDSYTTKAFHHLWATNEGVEQMMLNFTLNGEAKDLATVSDTGEVSLSSETITPENGYLLQKQAGKYETLKFIKELVSDSSNYHYLADSNSETQLGAQSTYLYSEMRGTPVAILFDGTWWQREATPVFNAMALINEKYSKENRRFGILPVPHSSGERVGEQQVYLGGLNSFVFLNNLINDENHIKAAEEFFKFVHEEESLKTFTRLTGSTRPYGYDFSEEELAALPAFTQSSWNIHKNASILNPHSNLPLVINNFSEFNIDVCAFSSTVKGSRRDDPVSVLRQVSAKEYFDGMLSYKQNAWKGLIR